MTPNKKLFCHLQYKITSSVTIAGKEQLNIIGKGSIKILLGNQEFLLTYILLVQDLTKNLLTYKKLIEIGFNISADLKKYGDANIRIMYQNNPISIGKAVGNIYMLENMKEEVSLCQENNNLLWHNRLGHINMKYLKKLEQLNNQKLISLNTKCTNYYIFKAHKLPFPLQTTRQTTRPLELIHYDICGPMEIMTKKK